MSCATQGMGRSQPVHHWPKPPRDAQRGQVWGRGEHTHTLSSAAAEQIPVASRHGFCVLSAQHWDSVGAFKLGPAA